VYLYNYQKDKKNNFALFHFILLIINRSVTDNYIFISLKEFCIFYSSKPRESGEHDDLLRYVARNR